MIGVLDYGMGNLHSVSSALKRLGVPHIISGDHHDLEHTDGLILPGVGAFKDAMTSLHDHDHVAFLNQYVEHKPLLGICLGMQLLFEKSEENGMTKGLSLLTGCVKRFSGVDPQSMASYKVPHMGWNHLSFKQPDSPLVQGLKEDFVYFVHSYYVEGSDDTSLIAVADYHVDVPAIVGKGHVFGAQFHPEKSGALGQAILKNFSQLAKSEKATL